MTKEEVYGEKIRPIMDMIIDVCREHKIAMLADFHVGEGMRVSTLMLTPEYDPLQAQIDGYRVIQQGGMDEVMKNIMKNVAIAVVKKVKEANEVPAPGKPRETH